MWNLTINILGVKKTEVLSNTQLFEFIALICNEKDMDCLKIQENQIDISYYYDGETLIQIVAQAS